MRLIIVFFIKIVILLGISQFAHAQKVFSYEEAEKYGECMLKKLKHENVAQPMQYKVLKKSSSFKNQVCSSLTIYEINSDFDLKGMKVKVPDHSVLVFNGGSLRNGQLTGDNIKYCVNGDSRNCIRCKIDSSLERIGYVVKASSVGMVKDDESKAKDNYYIFKSIIQQGKNIYLDGTYYLLFLEPLVMNRTVYIYGGKLVYRKNAFRFSDDGGVVVVGGFITASEKASSSYFCGSRDLLDPVSIKNISFIHCTINCNYLVNIKYKDLNSDEVAFGLKRLEVDHCVFNETGKIRVMDAVITERCSFTNNDYIKFTTTPIYLCCQHSIQASPKDSSAYHYVANNLLKWCPVIIDHNIFRGTIVSLDFYYCAALIKTINCFFTNNYLYNIINNSNGSNATAYDTYLSCVNVVYENNFVKDMMSYSINGSPKPQCQIGKSKSNPLPNTHLPAKRIYRNNVVVVNGDRFLKMGADAESLFTDIFGNNSYIDEYVWEQNSLIYRHAQLRTGVATKSYGSFYMTNNYFEVDKMTGRGLVSIRSDEYLNKAIIQNNTFKVSNSQLLPLFNQKYKEGYRNGDQKKIDISGNTFVNSSPKIFFFTGEDVFIKDNNCDKSDITGNMYLSKYSGSNTILDVKQMDVELLFVNNSNNPGGLFQYFSSCSNGIYSIDLDQIPSKGVNYSYTFDRDHVFSFSLMISKRDSVREIQIPFRVKDGKLCYEWKGHIVYVDFGKNDSKVWYQGDGIMLKSFFYLNKKKQFVTKVVPMSKTAEPVHVRFCYDSK